MAARAVQISLDERLLMEIDADPDVRRRGRSALIRAAVRSYLAAKKRRAVDAAIRKAYVGQSDSARQEIAELIEVQAWPDE